MFFKVEHNSELSAAEKNFADSRIKYSGQIFNRVEDINLVLKNSMEAKDLEKSSLSKNEAWKGLKWKAEIPHTYIAVMETAIIPKSRKFTPYGEFFTRLTIQPSFVTANLVIVKENIHINEKENKILFLGQVVDPVEAEAYLHTFDQKMLVENPALFHVEHALIGTQDEPIATWEMVRLCDRDLTDAVEAEIVDNIRKQIASKTGIKIYIQTIKQLNEGTRTLNMDK